MSQRASNGDKKQNVMFVTQNFRSEALIEVFLGKPPSYLSLRRRWRKYVVQAAPLARPLPLGLIVPNLCSRGPLTVDRFAPVLPRPDRIVTEEGMELLPPRFDLPIEAALAALLVNVGRARVLPPSPGPGSKPSTERGRGGKRSNGERGERSDLCGVLHSLSLSGNGLLGHALDVSLVGLALLSDVNLLLPLLQPSRVGLPLQVCALDLYGWRRAGQIEVPRGGHDLHSLPRVALQEPQHCSSMARALEHTIPSS